MEKLDEKSPERAGSVESCNGTTSLGGSPPSRVGGGPVSLSSGGGCGGGMDMHSDSLSPSPTPPRGLQLAANAEPMSMGGGGPPPGRNRFHHGHHHHIGHHHGSGSSSGSKEDRDRERPHKPTRVRTVLNEKQLHTLRSCYAANPRPDALMKEQLVEMTGLSPRVIRVWFQNKRCKDKKRVNLMKQMQQEKVSFVSRSSFL